MEKTEIVEDIGTSYTLSDQYMIQVEDMEGNILMYSLHIY